VIFYWFIDKVYTCIRGVLQWSIVNPKFSVIYNFVFAVCYSLWCAFRHLCLQKTYYYVTCSTLSTAHNVRISYIYEVLPDDADVPSSVRGMWGEVWNIRIYFKTFCIACRPVLIKFTLFTQQNTESLNLFVYEIPFIISSKFLCTRENDEQLGTPFRKNLT
jgi:hypothetical protein